MMSGIRLMVQIGSSRQILRLFPADFFLDVLFFKGYMWVIGGMTNGGGLNNEVWFSADGVHWNLATNNSGFMPRYHFECLEFNGKIWIIGGNTLTGTPMLTNDVWYSSDGTNWACATNNAAFGGRWAHYGWVLNDKMWVIGGISTTLAASNDVWYSSDGANWYCTTNNAGFSVRATHSSVEMDDKLWVIAGFNYNDVWSSENGTNWNCVASNAAFPPRADQLALVFKNRLWVIGGGTPISLTNDVWYSE